ncbi:MAG TPA: hypothetical protein VNM22_22955 [Candidatus Limnocylindrales bacterium]|nr:hypothetical protein [Candidatus Limnocylindrales bacterium]
MPTPLSLDERIASLVPEVGEEFRVELRHALQTLRASENPIGVLLGMPHLIWRLIEEILKCAGYRRPSNSLYDCILMAAHGDPEKKIKGLNILPDEMASHFHRLYKLSNRADHVTEQATLTVADAENALHLFLRVLEWFYCESEPGPHLPTIYGEITDGSYKAPEKLQEISQKRARLEKLLKERYTKPVAVMFITLEGTGKSFGGSSDLMDFKRLQPYRALLLPITEGQGRVIQTTGDTLIACFNNPEKAVKTAIEMQKILRETAGQGEETYLCIGINYGIGMVEQKEDGTLEVSEAAVNPAAWVKEEGKKISQVFISQSVYKAIQNSKEITRLSKEREKTEKKIKPSPIYPVVLRAILGITLIGLVLIVGFFSYKHRLSPRLPSHEPAIRLPYDQVSQEPGSYKPESIEAIVKTPLNAGNENFNLDYEGSAEVDSWTSQPVTLSFLPLEIKDPISIGNEEVEFFNTRLADFLQRTGRVVVVEQRKVEDLLRELMPEPLRLIDQALALQVGKRLNTRLVSAGTFTRHANLGTLQLYILETETAIIKGTFSQKLGLDAPSEEPLKRLAQKILEKIQRAYPLRGRIVWVNNENHLLINIGARQGITSGMILKIIRDGDPFTSGDQIIGYEKEEVGLLEITSVKENFSHGKVLKKIRDIEKGMKVEEIPG